MNQNDMPAFPGFEHFIHEPSQKIITGKPHGGMTLRDYFAGQALASFASQVDDRENDPAEIQFTSDEIERFYDLQVEAAYLIADKMLKARSQPSKEM